MVQLYEDASLESAFFSLFFSFSICFSNSGGFFQDGLLIISCLLSEVDNHPRTVLHLGLVYVGWTTGTSLIFQSVNLQVIVRLLWVLESIPSATGVRDGSTPQMGHQSIG